MYTFISSRESDRYTIRFLGIPHRTVTVTVNTVTVAAAATNVNVNANVTVIAAAVTPPSRRRHAATWWPGRSDPDKSSVGFKSPGVS